MIAMGYIVELPFVHLNLSFNSDGVILTRISLPNCG
jgi:hypothetical protein